jgi:hypothetical protein
MDRGVQSGRPTGSHPAPAGGVRIGEVVAALIAVGLSLWAYRGALSSYFSPDDLIYLERARGLLPQPPTLWRYLSGVAWFQAMFGAFGPRPFAFMLANWLLHGAVVAMLFASVRSLGGGVLAAWLAATLYGTSRLFPTVVGQAVTVAEPQCLVLALATLWLARRPGLPALLAALATFSVALLCKESVLLVPLLLLLPGAMPGGWRARVTRAGLLMLPGALIAAYMSVPAVHSAIFVNDVYSRAYGANLFHNLMTLTGWVTEFENPTPDLASVLSTTAWHTSLWVMLGFLALAALAWRTTVLPAFGLGWWLLTLAPVLPLVQQRYVHYLYVPLVGLAMAVGAGFEWAMGARAGAASTGRARPAHAPAARKRHSASRPSGRSRDSAARVAWVTAAVIATAWIWAGQVSLANRAAGRLVGVDVPLDPHLRKAELARRVVTRVGQAVGTRSASLVFVIPDAGPTRTLAGILHSILGEGRALRMIYPQLDSVAFVSAWNPAYRDFELFYGSVDGYVKPLGRGAGAGVQLVRALAADGWTEDAQRSLTPLVACYPDEPAVRALRVTEPR